MNTRTQIAQPTHAADPSVDGDADTKLFGQAHSAKRRGAPIATDEADCVVLLQGQQNGQPGLSLPEIMAIYGPDVTYVMQGARDAQKDRFTARRVSPNDIWSANTSRSETVLSGADPADPSLWHLPHARFDGVQQALVHERGTQVQLTSYEARILALLLRYRGRDVSRDRISELVFNRQWNPEDRSIDVHIARLRRKMKDAGLPPQLIQTVRGRGYCLAIAKD